MFFLTRAAICIGLVAAAASAGGGGGLATTLDHDAREAVTSLGQACIASPRCLRVGAAAMAGALPLAGRGASPAAGDLRVAALPGGPATLSASAVAATPPARPVQRAAHRRRPVPPGA